jgi:hypothetical protein
MYDIIINSYINTQATHICIQEEDGICIHPQVEYEIVKAKLLETLHKNVEEHM